MTESQFYEKIGRLQTELDRLRDERVVILEKFAGVLDGSFDPRRLLINLTDGSVAWSAEGERPGTPAQINGLPKFVVAPDGPTRAELVAEVTSLEARLATEPIEPSAG